MNLKPFKKMAVVSALAIAAAYAGQAIAATVQIDNPLTINVTATVENTLNVVTTPVGFGTVGAAKHATDIATLALTPLGVLTDDPGGGFDSADPAAIASGSAAGTPGTMTITAAIPGSTIYITYTDFVDLTAGGDAFTLTRVYDDATVVTDSDGGPVGPTNTIGQEVADGAGAVPVINIGAEIATEVATGPNAARGEDYGDGAYTGSFSAYLSY